MRHHWLTNVWQVVFEVRDVFEMNVPLLSELSFGIIKLVDYPAHGERLRKEHYKGFLITVRFYKWFEIR